MMYALVAGAPPFQSTDALDLIHMHLARSPPSLVKSSSMGARLSTAPSPVSDPSSSQLLLPVLLDAVSAIVSKLLCKDQEARYQNALGLMFDVRAILDILEGKAPATTLAMRNVTCLQKSTTSTSDPSSSFSSANVSDQSAPPYRFLSLAQAVAKLAEFRVGAFDYNTSLRISQRLYGREEEIKKLVQIYRRVMQPVEVHSEISVELLWIINNARSV